VAATREAARLQQAASEARARAHECGARQADADARLLRLRREEAAAAACERETAGAAQARAARVVFSLGGTLVRGSAACPAISVLPPADAQAGPRIRLWSRPKASGAAGGGRGQEGKVFYTLDGSVPTRQV
jgi:hypothetical protein